MPPYHLSLASRDAPGDAFQASSLQKTLAPGWLALRHVNAEPEFEGTHRDLRPTLGFQLSAQSHSALANHRVGDPEVNRYFPIAIAAHDSVQHGQFSIGHLCLHFLPPVFLPHVPSKRSDIDNAKSLSALCEQDVRPFRRGHSPQYGNV
jgi:hypothetical protein